jgi:hypothetical protein
LSSLITVVIGVNVVSVVITMVIPAVIGDGSDVAAMVGGGAAGRATQVFASDQCC